MQKQFVGFGIGENLFCIDIEHVKEVIMVDRITWMPDAPGFVEGIITLRGIVIPVISIRKKLKISSEELSNEKNKLVIVIFNNFLLGLLVDKFSYVFSIDESSIQNFERLKEKEESSRGFIKGVVKVDGSVYSVIDIDKILGEEEEDFIRKRLT